MGEKGSEVQCLAFINAVLESKSLKPITFIKILECKTFTAEILGEKTCILDVRAETGENEKANIEVQLRDLGNMERRSLFYWGREYTKGIEKGENYKDLPRIITINIVNFDNIKLDDYHTCFHLREKDNKDYILTDVLEIHFINMKKFRQLDTKDMKNRALDRWLTYLDVDTPYEAVEELVKMDGAIRKANERLEFVTKDKDFLRNYHLREMAMSDITSGIDTALEKGRNEGRIEGRIEGRNEGRIEGRNEGRIEGLNNGLVRGRDEVLELLDKGWTLEEIKRKFKI